MPLHINNASNFVLTLNTPILLIVASDLANYSHKHIGFSADEFTDSAIKIGAFAGEIAQQVESLKIIELSPDVRYSRTVTKDRLKVDFSANKVAQGPDLSATG